MEEQVLNSEESHLEVSKAEKEECGFCFCKKSEKSKKAFYISDIVRAALTTAFAFIMFILSFTGIFTVGLGEVGASDSLSGLTSQYADFLSVKVSAVDIVEGAFARLDPKSEEEISRDFSAYLLRHLTDRQRKVLDGLDNNDSNMFQAIKILSGVIEDYNVLKLASGKETTELSPSASLELWIAAGFSLFYILSTLIFFIYATINLVYTILKKSKSENSIVKSGLIVLTATIALGFISKMIFNGKMSSNMRAVLILTLCALVLAMVWKILTGEMQFKKIKIPLYISAGAGVILGILALSFASSSVLNLVCKSADNTFRAGYNASSFSGAWDAIRIAEENKQLYSSAATYIPNVFSQSSSQIIIENLLAPFMMGVVGNMEIQKGLAVLGVCVDVLSIAFILFLSLSVVNHFGALVGGRETKKLWQIVSLSLGVLLLVLVIIYIILVNKAMDNISSTISYKTSISGLCITAVWFVIADFVQSLVLKKVVKNRI